MLTETWFWVVVAVLVAALAALAIWKNGGIDVIVTVKGLVFRTRAPKETDAGSSRTASGVTDKVAERAIIEGEVKSIIGNQGLAGEISQGRSTEIAKQMRVAKGAKVEEIVANKITAPREKRQ